MPVSTDIDLALSDLEDIFGETVTIGSWTGTAVVTGGALPVLTVAGGVYEGTAFSITVRKSSLPDGFIPKAPMPAVVRDYEMRIAPDGVTNNRAHWRILLVDRDTPTK